MNGGNLKLSRGALADTGQWRLIITVSDTGMSAYFKNLIDPDIDLVNYLSKKWEGNEENLLQLVEETVYENPDILDDFATQIIIYTPESLWIPEELTDEEELDEKYFTTVFTAKKEDIFSDFGEEEVCLYALAPGLNSFFQRTLPGCKVMCHLTMIQRWLKDLERINLISSGGNSDRIYVNVRDRQVDLFAFRKGKFMSGSTHRWKNINDIIYESLLLAKAYEMDPEKTRLIVLGSHGFNEALRDSIQEFFPMAANRKTTALSEKYNLPFEVALAAGYNYTKL